MRSSLVLSSLLLLFLAACQKGPVLPKRSDFAARIERVLLPNWSLEEKGTEVIITRRESITGYGCVGLDIAMFSRRDLLEQHIRETGISRQYRIRLRRAEKLNATEYARLKAINDQITVSKATMIPTREFYENDAMKSFDPNYRELPEYFDDSSSIYVESTLHPWECMYPNNAAQECATMWKNLDALFSRYSKDGRRVFVREFFDVNAPTPGVGRIEP